MRIVLPDLQSGITYALQLRSTSGDGVSEWSNRFLIAVGSDTLAPEPPEWADENPWVVDGDTFVATWKPINTELEQNSDLSHYLITLSDGTKSVTVKSQNTIYVLTYNQNRNFFGTAKATITAKVASVDKIGNVSESTELLSATNPAPTAPENVVLTELNDAIKVDWDVSEEDDVVKYIVQLAMDSVGGTYNTVYNGPNNQYVLDTVQFANDHYLRVAAVDKFGSVSTYTTVGPARPKSSISGDTTPPNNATAFNATATAINSSGGKYEANVTLGWTLSTSDDVSHYEIRYSYDTTNWRFTQAPAENNIARVDGLQIGTPVYFGIRAVDRASNKSAWLNASTYPYTTATDNSAPATPVAPSVETDRLQLRVEIDAPANVVRYKAYAGTTSGFTANDDSLIGTFEAGTIGVFYYPTDSDADVYVKVIAVSRGGVDSAVSPASAAVSVPRINDAMIDSLAANKITAGEGIINDLIIKSDLTVGDGVTPGTIKSRLYEDSAGAEGYSLTDSGLIVRSGEIEASAVKISGGSNIVRPEYADFELPNYSTLLRPSTGTSFEVVSDGSARFGSQFLRFTWAAPVSAADLYFSKNANEYNTDVEAGKKYIVSAYLRRANPDVATNVVMALDEDGDAQVAFNQNLPAGSDWVRYYGVVTPTTNAVRIGFASSSFGSAAGFDIDGIQIEEAYGATTPSIWKAPSMTTIDGGMIRTGALESTAPAIDAAGNPMSGLKAWSINTQGQANFGDALIRGRLIVGDGSGPVVDPETGEETTIEGASQIQSYNYIEGSTGWMIRSNGVAEFRQIKSNSIHGTKLIIDSVDADRIRSEAINARHISVGAVSADKLASELILSSKIVIGQEYTTANIDPAGLPQDMMPVVTESNIVDLPPDPEPSTTEWVSMSRPPLGNWGQLAAASNKWEPTSVIADFTESVFNKSLIADGAPAWTTTIASGGPSNVSLRVRLPVGSPSNTYRLSFGIKVTDGSAKVSTAYGYGGLLAYLTGTGATYVSRANASDDTGIIWVDVPVRRSTSSTVADHHDIVWNLDSGTAGARVLIIQPQIRLWEEPVANSLQFPDDTGTSPGWDSTAVADHSLTRWSVGGVDLPAADAYTASWVNRLIDVRQIVQHPNSVMALAPSYTKPSGDWLVGDGRGIEQSFKASVQDTNAFKLVTRIPITSIPETGDGINTYLGFLVQPNASKSYYNKTTVGIYWYDSANQLVAWNETLWQDGTESTPKLSTDHGGYFLLSISPPPASATHGMVRFDAEFQGNNMPLSDVAKFYVASPRLFSMENINMRYGQIAGSRIEQDVSGITLLNNENQPQVRIPTDSGETAFFKGAGEFGSLRILGGLSLESTGNEVAKDAKLTLSNGITSPVSQVTIQQKYETVQCEKGTITWSNSTIDWSRVTSMVWHPVAQLYAISELQGSVFHLWLMNSQGVMRGHKTWGGGSPYSQVALFVQPEAIVNDVEGARISWVARFGNYMNIYHFKDASSSGIFNVVSQGAANGPFFANSNQPAAWWSSDGKFVMAQNVSSTRAWVKRYTLSNTGGATPSVFTHEVPAGGGGGLAGGYEGSSSFAASRWVLADRVNASTIKVFDEGTGSAHPRVAAEEWQPAGIPVAFCRGPEGFVQVDSNGIMTKYTDWSWNGDHKFHAGITWLDDDPNGTGEHETDLGKVTVVNLRKRISHIQVTVPQVPDKNGDDDPNKFRLYVAKSASTLSLPSNRTAFWSQYEGGSPSSQTTVTIPANGLETATVNPPAVNNFPGAGAGELHSFAGDGNGSYISLKGDGAARIGEFASLSTGASTLLRPRMGLQGNGSDINVTTGLPWTKITTWTTDSSFPSYGGISIAAAAGGFQVSRPGLYLVTLTISFSGGASGRIGASVDVNSNPSATYANRHHGIVNSPTNGAGTMAFSQLVWANSNDYVRGWVFQDSGATRTLSGASASQSMKIVLVSN